MIVEIDKIYKSFGSNVILENINARIEDNDRIGLIGSNGAGKSTLLNIITGILEADSGKIVKGSAKTFGFLKQNDGLNVENTIYTEMRGVFLWLDEIAAEVKVLEGDMGRINPETEEYKTVAQRYASLQNQYELGEGYQIDAKIHTVLNGMGFGETDTETMVGVLSGGEKTRLALCKLLLESPDLLILDEPTNHLDFPTLIWLEDYLEGYKGAILVVSHDRFFLDRLCKSIWEIQFHSIETYKGNYTKYLAQKDERYASQQKAYRHQQEEIANMKDFIQRNLVRASTTKRAQSRQIALDKMEKIPAPRPPVRPPVFSFTAKRSPVNDLLTVEDLKLSVGEDPRKELFENLSFELKRNEKMAIIGHNGVGKTSFFRVLLKKLQPDSGSIQWGRNVDLGYFEQGDGDLEPENTAVNEVWNDFPRESEQEIRTTLGRVGIVGEEVYKKVGKLSGGERARLKFAKLMLGDSNVIIMDEPTNHLDLPSKEALDKALLEFEGTLIVISHDRYLLNKFPDKIMEITTNGGEVYAGKYNDYMERKEYIAQKTASNQPETVKEPRERKEYRTREDRRKDVELKNRVSFLETEVEKLEGEIDTLESEISTPEVAADYILLQEKCDILEGKKEKLQQYLEEWSEIADI